VGTSLYVMGVSDKGICQCILDSCSLGPAQPVLCGVLSGGTRFLMHVFFWFSLFVCSPAGSMLVAAKDDAVYGLEEGELLQG